MSAVGGTASVRGVHARALRQCRRHCCRCSLSPLSLSLLELQLGWLGSVGPSSVERAPGRARAFLFPTLYLAVFMYIYTAAAAAVAV